VATKRRKIPPKRINEPLPAWVARLLAGQRPEKDGPDWGAWIGWYYLRDEVPGLPDPMSVEGRAILARAA
jgi:hypothetical protein